MNKSHGFCKLCLFIILLFLLRNYTFAETFFSSKERQFKIAIFKEEDFPSVGTPSLLTPEWLFNSLRQHFSVTYLDFSRLSNRECLNPDNFNLLIFPYGEVFPYDAFSSIKDYLYNGGGLLNIAGRPFWIAMEKKEGKWQKVNINDPYKEFLLPLGIKYYESLNNDCIGLGVSTSLAYAPVMPTRGNVFPYRIPVRDFSSLEKIKGRKKESSVIAVKSWRSPYMKNHNVVPNKWCLIGARGDNHPLDLINPLAKENLTEIVDYLSFPVILYDLETNFSAYHQGERVDFSVKVLNNGGNEKKCTIDLEISDKEGNMIYKKEKIVKIRADQEVVLNEFWHPWKFNSDFYKVTAILKNKNKILDREENGFVVINGGIIKNGPLLEVEGNKFIINKKKSYLLGTNYYESKLGELMWLRPNILKIREDFKSMQSLGINFIRIHYHHPKWFRDYFTGVKQKIDPYIEVADNTVLPSERSWRILDAMIQLAQEQGLIFCMDIFSLVPKEMGNPIGWVGMNERILDKNKISNQKEFVKKLAERYRDVRGITWDLWNEPRLEEKYFEDLKAWAKETVDVFRKNGDNHLITIGDEDSLKMIDILDYACIHTYNPVLFCNLKNLDKPFIFQEVWNDAGCSIKDEIRQAEELRIDFSAFLKTGAAGFAPWQWTRQARLWNNASDAERWDDELGLCVHDDGTLKSAGNVYSWLIGLMNKDKN